MQSVFITILCTVAALIAFAANSVLCRLALGEGAIDPASFTVIRLVSGAIMLGVIMMVMRITTSRRRIEENRAKIQIGLKDWYAPAMLFTYALAFSYAYVHLNTATGALILFGSVQLSMTMNTILKGQRPSLQEWAGIVIAFSGLVYLMLPSVQQPSLVGFVLMAISGIAWGMYSVVGKKATNPTVDTAKNFIRSIPFAIALLILTYWQFNLSFQGVLLAIASGAIASGMGYAIWYMAIKGLKVTQAAVAQLSVPLIAAVGGIIFVDETFSTSLMISMLLILGGISLVVFSKTK
ncbi:DMT family transporter [Aestuariibacter salexigens]|uniref:DMT family transporter n=1 Tax=Aestuariibacter salexigens TaxID=226010 RepID=UPI0003F8E72C|nr:DMT family transporter [Aestuariibacter salexigens]